MKVHGVRMVASIAKMNTDAVAFRGSNRGTRDAPVIGPGRKLNARDDFDVFIE